MSAAERQPATGVALRDPYPWADLADLVRSIERAGVRAVFLPEVGARDTLTTLAALAGETTEIALGTGVVPLPARSPSLLAMAAATVQERSGGRLILGLGTGPSAPGALGRLRETVQALRMAFHGGTGLVDGAHVRTDLPLPSAPEIWIAALGPKATRLAGEIADGVLLNWCPPERVATATSEIAAGAEAAGPARMAITVGVYVRVATVPAAREAALAMAAEYASYPAYRRQFIALGIDPTPEAVLDAVIVTDPGRAADRLEAYRDAGADLPIVYPILPAGPPDAATARRLLEPFVPGL